MFPKVNVINNTAFVFEIQALKQETRRSILLLNRHYKRTLYQVNMAFLTPNQIKALNLSFRQKNAPTDVLTFRDTPRHADTIAGDLALCPKIIFETPTLSSPKSSLYETLLHGMLHLYGLIHSGSETSLKRVYMLHQRFIHRIRPNLDAFMPR